MVVVPLTSANVDVLVLVNAPISMGAPPVGVAIRETKPEGMVVPDPGVTVTVKL